MNLLLGLIEWIIVKLFYVVIGVTVIGGVTVGTLLGIGMLHMNQITDLINTLQHH